MKIRYALLVPALAACGEPSPPALTVGPVAYSEDQLLGLPEARRQTLAHLTAFALAVADSSTAELGAPLVARWEDDRLLDLLAAELTLEKNGVGDDVLEARYRTDPEFELTVRHILFFSERWRTKEERAAAKQKAERALEALRGGADFAETAARLSEEPGAESRQGLLTPGREGAWVDEFWRAASALQVGEISPVTETEYGYHILRLEGRDTVPFSEARSRVALEVADRIEDPAAVLSDWMDERTGDLRIAAEALELTPGHLDERTGLASWGGGDPGQITYGDYAAWAATEPASWKGGGLGSDPEAFAASIRELARRRIALDEADRRGLAVSPADRARLERRWDDQVYQWSATLGFSAGGSVETVARAALAALGATGQGAGLARDALDERAPLLEARFAIRGKDTAS
jgi:hypothetical protein